ncbi:MAG: DUF3383 domain-containing protein [Rhodospirillaceae bacterium]|nr:MAG: DUF3383 domain-containing protein [Rhodospirillaceae bacterium]
MATGLPVSRRINVQVNLTPKAAQSADFNSMLILGSSDVIDIVTRMREYGTIGEVANDYGTDAPEYKAAVLWFEQRPQPTTLYIGRWAKTDTHGQLFGGPLSAQQQLIESWQTVRDGAFDIQVDGAVPIEITNLDFAAVNNMNGIASIISTALATHGAGCVWNATYDRFEITSTSSGAASSIGFLTTPDDEEVTDISAKLGGAQTSSGAYVVAGAAAESAVDAVKLFDLQFNSQWYGISVLDAAKADYLAVAEYIEAANPPHFQGVSTTENGVTISATTSDVASALKAGGFNKSAVQWSSSNPYVVCSLLSRILTTNWQANNSTITLMYKQEPGVVPETINSNQADAVEDKNCNVFVTYQNDTAIIENGVCSSGEFIDTIIGIDWLAGQIQTNVYNLLYTSPTKIPQTDAGMHQIAAVIEATCAAAVNNGLCAPGTWNSAGFGTVKMGDFLPKGFYVFTPPIASQPQADREARKSVPFQVMVKMAGAVHDVIIAVNVNR